MSFFLNINNGFKAYDSLKEAIKDWAELNSDLPAVITEELDTGVILRKWVIQPIEEPIAEPRFRNAILAEKYKR